MKARNNPFRTGQLNGLDFRFTGTTLSALIGKLELQDWRGAVVGPHGSGKTTLLEQLMGELKRRGKEVRHLRLDDGSRRIPSNFLNPSLGPDEVLCVDGVDLLPLRDRMRLKRQAAAAGGLIVTAHRPGFLPMLYRCGTSKELFRDLVSELLDGVRPGTLPDLEELYDDHRGNLRDAFLSLYDHY